MENSNFEKVVSTAKVTVSPTDDVVYDNPTLHPLPPSPEGTPPRKSGSSTMLTSPPQEDEDVNEALLDFVASGSAIIDGVARH